MNITMAISHIISSQVEAELKRSARVQCLEREFFPNFIFGPQNIAVVVGQDGLVANTLNLKAAVKPAKHLN